MHCMVKVVESEGIRPVKSKGGSLRHVSLAEKTAREEVEACPENCRRGNVRCGDGLLQCSPKNSTEGDLGELVCGVVKKNNCGGCLGTA